MCLSVNCLGQVFQEWQHRVRERVAQRSLQRVVRVAPVYAEARCGLVIGGQPGQRLRRQTDGMDGIPENTQGQGGSRWEDLECDEDAE